MNSLLAATQRVLRLDRLRICVGVRNNSSFRKMLRLMSLRKRKVFERLAVKISSMPRRLTKSRSMVLCVRSDDAPLNILKENH